MYFHRILLLMIPAVLWLLPLLIHSWQMLNGPWFMPFSAWFCAVLIAYLVDRRRLNG